MGAGVCCALLGADKCLLLSKNWPGQLSGVGGGDCQMMPGIDIQHKFQDIHFLFYYKLT